MNTLGASALIAIIALTALALGSRRVRRYAHHHPARYAALGALLWVASISAYSKEEPGPEPGEKELTLKLLVRPQGVNDPPDSAKTLRPLDFKVQIEEVEP